MTSVRTGALAVGLALSLGGLSLAAPAAGVSVSGAWSRPVAHGLATGVAYLTLRNNAPRADRLLGAETPVAARASLHQTMAMDGMMSMTPVAGGLALPPGVSVALAPGGYHLMLEGLRRGLKAGDRYPVTLRFARAKPQTVSVTVSAQAPAGGP